MKYTIGIDVGGTFTDFLVTDLDGHGRIFKILSTPDDPSDAVFAGLTEIANAQDLALDALLSQVGRIVHGTTVTTNAILTGCTVPTGLLTTSGFRDALQMRRGIREKLYDNKYLAPVPIVPRWLRRPVQERIDQAGTAISPLVLEDVDAAAEQFRAAGVEAVAICFMHSYANAAHERAAAARLRASLPDIFVSSSSEVLPQVRFYERTSTTVLNAAVGPILNRYLDRLTSRLDENDFGGALLIMQSNGGVCTPEAAARLPASTLLSGPAAGPIAGQVYAGTRADGGYITVDMGGTSFEASMARGGTPAITTGATINRFAMALPSMDIKTIGAGGGSISWIDNGGLLRMGPQSAGAKPGPVCYGLGGVEPTCSDANLVLGYLSETFFAGGRIQLNTTAATAAIEKHIAAPLDLDVTRAAAGMYHVMNVNMASAIREISIERGYDPRDFPLVCAGGAAAIHAGMIARELGIREVLIPREASILCAAGMLRTDLRHDLVRSYATPFTAEKLDQKHLAGLISEMQDEGGRMLVAEGISEDQHRISYALDLRYVGQYHEVRVDDVPECMLAQPNFKGIRELFHQAHDRLYGYALDEGDTVVELVNVRLCAIGLTEKPAIATEPVFPDDPSGALKGLRPVYLPDSQEITDVPVYDGDLLRHGNRLDGPAIVESSVTTILVPDNFGLSMDALGTAVLTDQSAEAVR
jgi:N-methylhydantoinase A